MSTVHQPLLVRAHLAAGIAQAAPWGIALDSLLASQLWTDEKARLRAAGDEPLALHDNPHPTDLPLPLAICRADDSELWHWAATTAWPEGRPEGLAPDVHTWTGRLDARAAELNTPQLPKVVSERQGRYRSRRMPLLVTVCTAVTWTAVGDLEVIKKLLTPIRAIGKKRAHGEGHVLGWEVLPAPHLGRWEAAHLHPTGALGRPTPVDCLSSAAAEVLDGGPGTAGLRPPYMHRSRQHPLRLPVSLDQ